MTKIAVIGGGNIGEALISGLIAGGIRPQDINVSNRREERGRELAERFEINDYVDNYQAVEGVDVVFLAVKPYMIVDVLEEISDSLNENTEDAIVVSMAAGISLAAMEEVVSAGTPLVRVMPNTPMFVGKGVSAMAAGRFAGDVEMDTVAELLSAVGEVVRVRESDIDVVTAMSGSSPAYVFLMAEAMTDAGVQLGLKRELAEQLAVNAIDGAAAMLKEGSKSPVELRASVSSPAGTTAAAIRSLEESGFRGAFYRAMEACAKRSAELS
ncbi:MULTISPECIES: pyrroline-5-carboxylate reductase [Corynebacterium]|uniref:pyrroline-5-carboxylate reductase n=1 Tax=Corynebacterium TaxID=1716 RepID=UPI00124D7F45|nr:MULTISPECIES: pyrroline-5-carboxylate reductase [Corynebacterium]